MALVGWIAFHRVRIPGARTAAAVALACFAASLAVPGDRGPQARYYATDTPGGLHERSSENRDRDFTRVDARLDFAPGSREFPLAFVNDHTRFNFMRAGEPDRRRLAFAAAWTGWWYAEAGAHTIYVHAPQAVAQLSIDGDSVLASTAQSGGETRDVTVDAGWHRLHVTFSSPYGAPREFSAGIVRDGRREPFAAETLRTNRVDGRQHVLARSLAIVKPVADAMALAWLTALGAMLLARRVGELWQRRLPAAEPALTLFMAVAAIEAVRFAWPWADRLRIMTAGDDTMVYEGYARDILLNGILMNGGLPLGQGEPFYFQAFYPYFLAASHALFGESFYGALLVQRLLVAVTAVTLTLVAMRIRGQRLWAAGLAVSSAFVYWKMAPISADLLSEALYVPLMALSVLAIVDAAQRQDTVTAARAGLLAGVTAITRSTAMLAWALLWIALFVHLRRGQRARVLTVLIGITFAVFSLITVRNAIVSHRFVPASTEFGITLRGGNEPPGDVVLNPAPRMAIYQRLGVSVHTIDVIEYAIAAPGRFAGNMGRKALFVLGVYEPYAPGWGYSPVYIATWLGAAAGFWWLWRQGRLTVPASMAMLVALTQFLVIAVVYPKGERLILPVHTMWVPYAAIAVYELWAGVARRSR